jgi:hypothetical protein
MEVRGGSHGPHLLSIFSKSAMRAEKLIATSFCKRKEERNFWLRPRSEGIRIVANREIRHVEANDF